MIDFGNTLRTAREQKGLTLQQLAEQTHMLPSVIEGLESEDFSRIAAPIYGRGFVKLYCEAVGLEPQPLVAEFMDIFNGNRPAVIRRRDEPAEPAPPTVVSAPPTVVSAPSRTPEPEPEPASPEPTEPQDSLFASRPEPEPEPDDGIRRAETGPSRYAAPQPIDDEPHKPLFKLNVPPAVWRLGALAVGALLVLWLLCAGIHALYSALTTPSERHDAVETSASTRPSEVPVSVPSASSPTQRAGNSSTPSARRTPLDIPPLYID